MSGTHHVFRRRRRRHRRHRRHPASENVIHLALGCFWHIWDSSPRLGHMSPSSPKGNTDCCRSRFARKSIQQRSEFAVVTPVVVVVVVVVVGVVVVSLASRGRFRRP